MVSSFLSHVLLHTTVTIAAVLFATVHVSRVYLLRSVVAMVFKCAHPSRFDDEFAGCVSGLNEGTNPVGGLRALLVYAAIIPDFKDIQSRETGRPREQVHDRLRRTERGPELHDRWGRYSRRWPSST